MADNFQSRKKDESPRPTQQFVEVKGVKNGVLILKNGGLRQILMVAGLNFDLKSEEEQEAITYAYQNFLNSLNFPLQIFVHSRKVNIERYLESLEALEIGESNPLLKNQIIEYREFIRSFVAQNAIMDKSFFAVVPFDPVQIPEAGKQVTKKFFGLISKSKTPAAAGEPEEADLTQYFNQLAQRADQVITGFNQIGLRAVALNDDEAVELLYNLYNPESTEKKGLEISKGEGEAA